jgi:hypothetical protein
MLGTASIYLVTKKSKGVSAIEPKVHAGLLFHRIEVPDW